ncbi:ATP-binding cassette domain-containing protein [Microbacterium sp. CBS5P-1]|nr:ATP-binding cassette domain-containing protein [Microbacterium excoecariae]NHI16591.1 ATP-binding cassette domain-containing protein [Microbacterium excoecariae]
MNAAVEFRGVSKRFPDGTLAVYGVDLVVERGTTTCFVGSSGSGKTTALRMINRMVDPTSGVVLVGGEDVAGREPVALRRSIGYVMQHAGLLPHRTVVDNVATVPLLSGTARAAARERAMEMMAAVGLDTALAKRYPSQLSGGQQQRVGVARALAADTEILLMDEPFGAVDPVVRAELQEELRRLREDFGKTIVFVTHDIDEAFLLGDQVALFRPGGRVAQIGSPQELLETPADDFVARFIDAGRPRSILR